MKQTFWQDYKISVVAIVRPPISQDMIAEYFTAMWEIFFITFAVFVNILTLATLPLTALICTSVARALRNSQEKRESQLFVDKS